MAKKKKKGAGCGPVVLPMPLSFEEQVFRVRDGDTETRWSVPELSVLAAKLPVYEMTLKGLCLDGLCPRLGGDDIFSLLNHFQRMKSADLDFPIILDQHGAIMDGRHRIMKALLEKRETIKFVRFDVTPPPCSVKDV